jgi:glycogen debranching enzyme
MCVTITKSELYRALYNNGHINNELYQQLNNTVMPEKLISPENYAKILTPAQEFILECRAQQWDNATIKRLFNKVLSETPALEMLPDEDESEIGIDSEI